jgi:hypothetical protein
LPEIVFSPDIPNGRPARGKPLAIDPIIQNANLVSSDGLLRNFVGYKE